MKRLLIPFMILALAVVACADGGVGLGGRVTLGPDATTSTTTQLPIDPTVPTTEVPTAGPTADEVFVELFFVDEGLTARSVLRAVDAGAVGRNAIQALIAGPTPAEADTDLSSDIPSDTLLLGLTIESGLATIDLSREFEVGGGSFSMLSRLAQVVYTLTQFATVDEVAFRLDGSPVEVFSGEGIVLDGPVGRDAFLSALPIGAAEPAPAATPWSQDDLPDVTLVDPSRLGRVALVSSDDVLNVRIEPGAGSPIIGMLEPGVRVERTGIEHIVGSSTWASIRTPLGAYWVADWYLAAVVSAEEFADDGRVQELLEQFADAIVARGDLRPMTSSRGILVSHHSSPIRFAADEMETILTDPTTYRWPSNALSEDDPEFLGIPGRTFTSAVADSFVSAFRDGDTLTTINEPIEGGNGRLPSHAIPAEFTAFNYVGIHDPGDNPDYGGLDWTTWYVSIDFEDGQPVIVGLTIDQWSP